MMDLIRTISEAPSFWSCSAFRQNPTWLTCSLVVSETLPSRAAEVLGQEPRTGLEAAGNAGADHDAQDLVAVERGAVLRRRARRPFCKKAKVSRRDGSIKSVVRCPDMHNCGADEWTAHGFRSTITGQAAVQIPPSTPGQRAGGPEPE